MESSVVLHLGAHKTGTSLIQRYMRDHKALMQKNRLDFTARSETNQFLGWGKPNFIRENISELIDNAKASLKNGAKHFVVSHENALGRPFLAHKPGLYPDSNEAAAAMRDMLRGLNLRVIFYIRSQPDFVESYYLQTIHQGSYLTFKDWREDVSFDSLSWRPVIENLRSNFGESAVTIKNFGAEIKAGQNDFLRSFFEVFLGPVKPQSFGNFSYDEYKNPSIGRKGLEIALAANSKLSTRKERKAMRVFLQTHFSNIDYPRPHLLNEKEKKRLEARYAKENAELVPV